MKKHLLSGFIMLVFFFVTANAQIKKTEIRRIYTAAEKLYKAGNYPASLDYLKKEGGTLLNSSDSLTYLIIMNLENLYRTDFQKTTELESTFKLFFGKANKKSFPEIKYNDISRIFTVFQGFREKDRIFYDSVSRVMDLNNHDRLPFVRAAITGYQKSTPNTYYSKEFTAYLASIDSKLNVLATLRNKQLSDSTRRARLKAIGKKTIINIGYSMPVPSSGVFIPFTGRNDVINFFNGKGTTNLGEKYSLNFSFGNAMMNMGMSIRSKAAVTWSAFDAEFTKFNWSPDTLLLNKNVNGQEIIYINSVKAGTRIGLILITMLSKKSALGVYYSARPGIQFLIKPIYFNVAAGSGQERYEIKPQVADFNLSHEFGLRIYFFERTFINFFVHIGNYTWKNNINNLTVPNSGSLVTDARYSFRDFGFRIGL